MSNETKTLPQEEKLSIYAQHAATDNLTALTEATVGRLVAKYDASPDAESLPTELASALDFVESIPHLKDDAGHPLPMADAFARATEFALGRVSSEVSGTELGRRWNGVLIGATALGHTIDFVGGVGLDDIGDLPDLPADQFPQAA